MSKRKAKALRQSDRLSAPRSSPPSTNAANAIARPTTPSSAVTIPGKLKQHKSRHHADTQRSHHSSSSRGPRDTGHSPDAIPPSVAALLAITNIPHPNRRGNLRHKKSKEARMTVDSIVPRSRVSEKELSREFRLKLTEDLGLTSFERSPMDVLLSPPEELEEEEASFISDSGFTSPFSTRVASFDSLPSLGDSLGTSALPSVDSPVTPRGRRSRPPRRSLEPLMTPPGEQPGDPLSKRDSLDVDRLDFRAFSPKPTMVEGKQTPGLAPLKSAFKSNLTASLRALRSAARSLSTFTASSIPPDDFLTRSILTIDPSVPFTDERRPPVLEEEPSEAMRRYLNPTTSLRSDSRTSSPVRSYTASIQMQTYKVQRSKGGSRATRQAAQSTSPNKSPTVVVFPPGPRQREMRENSDFIRIAVMEHLMRKSGKLDAQQEGHARWLLPPRKGIPKAYEIGPGGVPVRTAAYVSFFEFVPEPRAGKTLFVSSASGGVGQIVGRIAKMQGMKVVGSAGGDEKVDYVVKELGFDEAWNYKKEKTSDSLKRLAPGGLDVYYDNVGGEQLESALLALNDYGTVVVSGMVSQYNKPLEDNYGVKTLMQIVFKRLRVFGFICSDRHLMEKHAASFGADMFRWLVEGKIKTKEEVLVGMDRAPEALIRTFQGDKFGKMVLKVDEGDA
ncbi:Uu.00g004910.m01.CDS01 [Anthostomella pinea]|uniref:Dehydrogenase FUB6 n=1 Tax=Anthostomella pinea TaxID=933095 RepID=A0AAI8YIR3_9PEZI|nr:Uu.00g004910.m01.CDS01 [Anthostomella pinea]